MTFLAETPEAEGARAPSAVPTRHERMIAAAETLARSGFARIGWALQAEGKRAGSRTGNRWQSTAIEDPALVSGLLYGTRNSLVIPKGRGLVIDLDDPAGFGELEAAGLPPTLTIDSPTPGHGHVYGWAPADVDMATIPGTFTRGEIRRHDPRTGTASMVLGPWSLRADGTYTPRGDVRAIAELPRTVIDYLIASAGRQDAERKAARGPADPGWVIHHPGRHDELVDRARNLRGHGLTGGRLRDELLRFAAERCCPGGDGCEPYDYLAEIASIAGWTMANIPDDPPAIRIIGTRPSGAEQPALAFPEPEDRGLAALSDLGETEYVDDLVRPGRVGVVAGEEGSGKSFAIAELTIRVAIAGGSFAGTWPVLTKGPVLVLSEMHPDDDYAREETILASLELERSALASRYYRLPLMTAAGDAPALMSDDWLAWITAWLRVRGAVLMVVDTATGASQVDPWGKEIQAVYRKLRAVLADYPALAILLIVHLKKPQGTGARRLSDVLGEWGRWCDVVVLLEHDGTRTRITTRKRVRHERRIAATKAGGLLVDPIDLEETKGTKVGPDAVLAAIEAQPGLSYAELGAAIGVSKDTAARYAQTLGERVDAAATGPRGATRLYATAAPPQTAARTEYGGRASDRASVVAGTAAPPQHRIGAAVPAAVVADSAVASTEPDTNLIACADYEAHHALEAHRWQDDRGWVCHACDAA
jgi:AAA domain/Bifunctional DNA primase/polymerase, N-terminal